jgi:SIR2-like domain
VLDPIVSLSVAIAEGAGSYALLVGSGVSADAGVPTGDDVFWTGVADLHRLVTESSEEPDRDALQRWLTDIGGQDWTYSEVLERLAQDAPARRDYLAKFFEGRTPGPTHERLASLAADGLVRVFVTTNFDRLLEHALQAQGVEPVILTSDDDVANAVPREHAGCVVLKPHGDYLQQTIRNTAGELSALPAGIDGELRAVFERYGLVIVGYSGADPAIADALRARRSRMGMYWVARGSPAASAQVIIEATGARVIVRDTAAAFLADLRGRLDVYRQHPSGLTPDAISREVVAALARGDMVSLDELMRIERRALEDTLTDATYGRHNETPNETNVRELHTRMAPILERRLLGLLPLVDHSPEQFERELDHLAALRDRRPRVGGTTFWIHADEWPQWWLTHALGAYALRARRFEAIAALLRVTVSGNRRPEPLAGGHPGTTTSGVAELAGPRPPDGKKWKAPELEDLATALQTSRALQDRYPEIVAGPDEPRRALGEWDFVLCLSLGLRGLGSVGYWTITPSGAQSLARRLRHDDTMRGRLAEAMDVTLEDLDARSVEALGRSGDLDAYGDREAIAVLAGQD